jgi:hypothetical protein
MDFDIQGDRMMKTCMGIAATTILAAGLTIAVPGALPRAQATEVTFSYQFASTGNTLSGTMDGTLLGDGNTFDVTAVDSLFVDGSAVPLPTVASLDATYLAIDDPIAITLDGSYFNLYATDGTDVFLFSVGDVAGYGTGATRGYGGTSNPETFVQANWSASLSDVPEPSSMVLLLAPLGLLAMRPGGRKARCVP